MKTWETPYCEDQFSLLPQGLMGKRLSPGSVLSPIYHWQDARPALNASGCFSVRLVFVVWVKKHRVTHTWDNQLVNRKDSFGSLFRVGALFGPYGWPPHCFGAGSRQHISGTMWWSNITHLRARRPEKPKQ